MISDAAAMVGIDVELIALFGFDLIQKPRKNGAPRRSWYKRAVENRLRILTTIPTLKIWLLAGCSMASRWLVGGCSLPGKSSIVSGYVVTNKFPQSSVHHKKVFSRENDM